MPWELIYTSAPRLLTAGQTGFGTVARHRDIPLLVVSAVERATQFARLPGMDSLRVVFSHRVVDVVGSRYHVLSRIASAGADYTGRTNHLAHHLIVTAPEAAALAAQQVSAADVSLRFPWRTSWEEVPRWLSENEASDLLTLAPPQRASGWEETTGNPLHAQLLIAGAGARHGCIVIAPASVEMRGLFAESLRALPTQGWQFTFTTELDPGDTPADFRWVGFSSGSPVLDTFQAGRRLVLDLTRPNSLPAAEPLPEKSSTILPGSSKPPGPPRIPAPVGGAFVEPELELPLPLAAQMSGSMAPPPPRPWHRKKKQATAADGHEDNLPWTMVAGLIIASIALLVIVVHLFGRWKSAPLPNLVQTPAPELMTSALEAKAEAKVEIPKSEPSPAVAAPSVGAIAPAPPRTSPAPLPQPGSVPASFPWRAAHASQLHMLSLPELRPEQVHFLITSRGEQRGPLFEARNNLTLSLQEPSPVLRLDYAAHQATWSAARESAATPPVQWRILQDDREVLRVLIGDGSQDKPLEDSPVSATQDQGGVIGGAFAGYMQRFSDQALWLRPSTAVATLLRECGYAGSQWVPLREMKADISQFATWISQEHSRVEATVNAPVVAANIPAGTPAKVSSETEMKRSATRSKETNTLENRPPPTSSVAGTMEQAQEQHRAAAKKRLAKLAEFRDGDLMKGRFGAGTCSFFAGPPECAPKDAVWICDVVFAEP